MADLVRSFHCAPHADNQFVTKCIFLFRVAHSQITQKILKICENLRNL